MIRLNQIDYRRLLDGARMPLVRVLPDPLPEWAEKLSEPLKAKLLAERYEWRLDRSWLFEDDEARWCDADPEWTALDPSDAVVARWSDRKIAEMVRSRRSAAVEAAQLTIFRRAFVVLAIHAGGRCYSWQIHGQPADAIRQIGVTPENIATARVALVRHYYPPKVTS